MRIAGGATEGRVEFLIGDDAVFLRADELARLLDALAPLDRHEAFNVAEDITALRLAGGAIRLWPTEGELETMRDALVADGERAPLGPALRRLVGLCDPVPCPPRAVHR
jgi:hypothetical protein